MARPALLSVSAPAVLLLLAGLPVGAWGEQGHKASGVLALRTLPVGARAWFADRDEAFAEALVAPDRWKSHDRKEGPRHYLDIEIYGGPSAVPREVEQAIAKIGRKDFERKGQVPWVIQDRYRDLVAAFRDGDPAQVVVAAGTLGHYVGDAQVPLHTSDNHDGQLTGQRGVHSRWETGLVSRFVDLDRLQVRPARPGTDLREAPFRWLEEAHVDVPALLRDDRAGGEEGEAPSSRARRSGYWAAFWAAQGPVVERQLVRAGERLGDLILSAWIEAGRPTPKRRP